MSEIPRMLSDLGGRQATDVRSLQQQQSSDYQENPMASYFTPKSDSDESSEELQQTIRTRFGLDMQLMSMRSFDDPPSHEKVVPAEYFGGLEFHDGREESHEPEQKNQLASLPLESLPEGNVDALFLEFVLILIMTNVHCSYLTRLCVRISLKKPMVTYQSKAILLYFLHQLLGGST